MIVFVISIVVSALLGFNFGICVEKHLESERRRKQYRVPVKFGDYTPPDVPRRRPF